jgi:hypothetical protein
MSSPIPRLLKMAVLGSLVGVGTYFIARAFFVRASDLDWDQTAAVYPSPAAPEALVHGWTKTPLGDWRFSLLWKAAPDKWYVYDLDQAGTQWDHYAFRKDGESLYVLCNGSVVGVLDPARSEFTHVREKKVDQRPAEAVHAANLDHEAQWVPWPGGAGGP